MPPPQTQSVPTPAPATPAQRQALLADILRDRPGATQDRLVADLAESGVRVTQATVSRDLAAIGAVRGPDGYRLPEAVAAPVATGASGLARALRDHAIRFELAASLVVVGTAPGHAPVLASELDRARPDGMVGCIAGDDTIFIATRSPVAARRLLARLASPNGPDRPDTEHDR